MDTFTLAGTSTQASRIVFGAMTFGAQVDRPEAEEMVQTSRDAGITFFDTSNNYNDGRSEEILGAIVKPFREQVLISTKGGSTVAQEDASLRGLGREAVFKAVEGSLKRLGTDYIDLYYLHRPDRNTPIEETLGALHELVEQGKIRQIGQSNFAAWQIAKSIYQSRANGWPEMRVSQQMYNLLGRRIEAEYVEAASELGLSTIVYNPLAGGLLTGKHTRDGQPEPGSRFTKELYRERFWNDTQFTAIERLQAIADQAGLTLIELSFRWVLGRPATDAMLLGASSLGQLQSNLKALEGPALDADALAACDAVWDELLVGVAPNYNR